ncbi:MAG: adenosylcobinamide-GDP ribazoletransferase [Oleiphilaceae bacterium]|nr:adenosylcobinamide-GDP ribazoletransferase [Oleiphilaceae bacterium]
MVHRNTNEQRLQEEWQALWLALSFITRLPMLVAIDYSPALMNRSSVYFPLVGLLLGGLYAGLFSILSLLWAPLVCVLLVLVFHLWITGAFHEDGMADSIDALGGGYTVEARLRIMKDSRIGTYGTVSLVLALALKAALLLSAPQIWLALLISPCAARLTPLILMRFMPYVSDPDKSRTKPVAESFSTARLIAASLFVLASCLLLSIWAPNLVMVAAIAIAAVAWLWGRNLDRNLGGYTGDALGASVVFAELGILLGLAILAS